MQIHQTLRHTNAHMSQAQTHTHRLTKRPTRQKTGWPRQRPMLRHRDNIYAESHKNGVLPGIVMTDYITAVLFTFGFPIHPIWVILCWLTTTHTSHPLPKCSIHHLGPYWISIPALFGLNKNWLIQSSVPNTQTMSVLQKPYVPFLVKLLSRACLLRNLSSFGF